MPVAAAPTVARRPPSPAAAISAFAPWMKVLREALIGLGAGVVSAAIAVIALRITPTVFGQRWTAGTADMVLHYDLFTSGVHTFPYLPNHHLGFPHAQNLFFAPLFDFWSAIYVRLAGLLGASGITALNLYNVLAFVAVGAAAYLFFRALRVRWLTSAIFAVIVSLLPYHFIQLTEGHPFIANYWAVPLIGILALMMAEGSVNPLASWIGAASSTGMRVARRLIPILILTAAVAGTQSYFYVFALILLGLLWGTICLHRLIVARRVRGLLWPTITLASLVGFVGVELAVLTLDFGDRTSNYFSARAPEESEYYAGKLVSLLLPSAQSGITPFAHLAQLYARGSTIVPTAEPPGSAVIGVLGMGLLALALMVRALAPGSGVSRLARLVFDSRVGVLAVVFFWGLLFYVTGGLNIVFSYAVSPEIRSWSRLAVVLSTLGLGFLALLLDRALPRRALRGTALVLVCLIAFADQVVGVSENVRLQPTDDSAIRAYAADAAAVLPKNCGIVELPLKGFPETGAIGAMGDYDEGLPYVYQPAGSTLSFSYGAVRGTNDALPWALVTTPAEFEQAVEQTGACAVQVDTTAYDSSDAWRAWVATVGDPDAPLVASPGSPSRYLLFAATP